MKTTAQRKIIKPEYNQSNASGQLLHHCWRLEITANLLRNTWRQFKIQPLRVESGDKTARNKWRSSLVKHWGTPEIDRNRSASYRDCRTTAVKPLKNPNVSPVSRLQHFPWACIYENDHRPESSNKLLGILLDFHLLEHWKEVEFQSRNLVKINIDKVFRWHL